MSDICAAADADGINVHKIPVTPGNITTEDVQAFDVATGNNPHPILAYCRSGARATTLLALSAASRGQSVEVIIDTAGKAGYDLRTLAPRLVTSTA